MPYLLQTSGEDLDYSFDWSDYLDDQGSPSDTIASSDWSVEPDVGSPSPEIHGETTSGSTASAFLKNLTPGEVYSLVNTVVTAAGRTGQKQVTIRCERRR